MLAAFLLVLLTVYGFGLACPVPRAPLGVRLTFGSALLVIALVLGTHLTGISLRVWSASATVLSLIFLAALVRRISPADDLKHPAAMLAAVAVLAITFGPGTYLPVSGDELGGWLMWARKDFAADLALTNRIGYTTGWPLLMAFPNFLGSVFHEGKAFTSIVVLHISVLALIADFVRQRAGTIAAWIALMLILTAEGMWTFFPSDLLIERPQIYSYVATLILLVWMIESDDALTIRWAAIAGATTASAYLLKIAGAALVPALLLAAAIVAWERRKAGVICAAVMLVPLVVLMTWWKVAASAQATCLSDPELVFRIFSQDSASAGSVAANLASKIGAYYAGYKLPVTATAIAGFIAAGRKRIGILFVLLIAGLSVAYFSAMLVAYVGCFGADSYTTQNLLSYERYGRVILRIFHTLGLVLLVLCAAEWVRRRPLSVGGRAVSIAVSLAVAVFLTWQGIKAHGTLVEVATRVKDGERALRVAGVRHGAERIVHWREKQPHRPTPKVLLVAQNGYGEEIGIVNYYRVPSTRGDSTPHFTPQSHYSFGPTSANVWMVAATPEQFAQHAAGADILWAIALDDYARAALRPILDACPDGDMMLRNGAVWSCLPR